MSDLKRQCDALSKARRYARNDNLVMSQIWVERAMNIRPLSSIQWFNLMTVSNPEFVHRVKNQGHDNCQCFDKDIFNVNS